MPSPLAFNCFEAAFPLRIVRRQASKDDGVLLPMSWYHASVILTESIFKTPGQTIFSSPMNACQLGESLCTAAKAR